MPQSALIVRVPQAEACVGHWRERFDPSARLGVPAHITLLFPFMPPQQICPQVLQAVADLCASTSPFSFTLRALRRFPGVLYLAPQPVAPFIAMTERLVGLFPQFPPYAARHDRVTPHLTVAQGDDAQLRDVHAALAAALGSAPIRATCTEIDLIENSGGRWQPMQRFALQRRRRGRGGLRQPAVS